MRAFLLLCFLGVVRGGFISSYKPIYEEHVPVIVNGVPEETPEVQQAKAEHFAAVAREIALHQQLHNKRIAPQYTGGYYPGDGVVWRHKRSLFGYPQHVPIITKEGVPLETPEVLQAKAQHFQAVRLAQLGQTVNHQYTPHYHHQQYYWGYVPRILPSGVPEDTPEVQRARAQHLAIHAQESAKHSGWW